MAIKLSIYFIVIITFFSCQEKPVKHCQYTFRDLMGYGKDRFVIYSDTSENTILAFDAVKDTFPTGMYIFDSDSNLILYSFVTSGKTFNYKEEMSIEGQYHSWLGSPLVRKEIVLGKDSIKITFFMFNLFYDFMDIKVSSSNNDFFKPTLTDNFSYSNIKSFILNFVKDKNVPDELYLLGAMTHRCLSDTLIIKDTLKIPW